jgi:adenylate cyclase
VVLIGATAVGTHDLRSTPIAPVYPGTEIHATVVDNILTGRTLERPRWWKVFDLLSIVGLTATLGWVLPRLRAVTGLVFQSALLGAFLALAAWLFARHGVWIDVVHPVLAISVNYTGLTTYRFLSEERERRRIKSTFRQYVAPGVVEEMLKNPQQLKLGGEEKILTVLFSDLEGFTGYSERYSPREMIAILSEYYGRVTEQVFAHRGTLKEYVGDELMAFFGAPFEQADHAGRACSAALAMREKRLALNSEWAAMGRPQLRARTGINSGPMLVGNLGSKYRFAYGVLGDQVNLGSRLEGLNRVYGTEILMGENTARLVGDAFVLRDVDLVRAKGKQQAIRVYELVARSRASLPLEQGEALALYGAGMKAYREQRWNEALALFEQASSAWPQDGPSRTMAERCRTYQAAPPGDGWDGVFEQTLRSLKGI